MDVILVICNFVLVFNWFLCLLVDESTAFTLHRFVNDVAQRQHASSCLFLTLDVITIRRAENIVQLGHRFEAAF